MGNQLQMVMSVVDFRRVEHDRQTITGSAARAPAYLLPAEKARLTTNSGWGARAARRLTELFIKDTRLEDAPRSGSKNSW